MQLSFSEAMIEINQHNRLMEQSRQGLNEKIARATMELSSKSNDPIEQLIEEVCSALPSSKRHWRAYAAILCDSLDLRTGLLTTSYRKILSTYQTIIPTHLNIEDLQNAHQWIMFEAPMIAGLAAQSKAQYKQVIVTLFKNAELARLPEKRMHRFIETLERTSECFPKMHVLEDLSLLAGRITLRGSKRHWLFPGSVQTLLKCNQEEASYLSNLYNRLPQTPFSEGA